MPSIPGILSVTVTRVATQVDRAGFGTLLIVGENGSFGGNRIRTYTDITGVAGDFATSAIEYKLANDYFSQEPKPQQVKIGIYSPVQYVGEFAFDGAMSSGSLDFDYNGQTISESFDTDLDTTVGNLATTLAALDDVATAIASGSTGTSDLKITITATEGYTISITNIVVPGTVTTAEFTTTVEGETYEDALNEIVKEDANFYGVVIGSRLVKDWTRVAAWISANGGIFYTGANTADYYNAAVTDDWLSVSQDSSYLRVFNAYSSDADNYIEAAVPGKEFTKVPGSYTMKFKTLTGLEVDNLSATQKQTIHDKNGNTYTRVAGANILENGKVGSGISVDSVRGQDWLAQRIMEDIYQELVSAEKIPFTDAGIAIIENVIRARLDNGVAVGYVAPGYEVSLPTLAEVLESDRLARELKGITFEYNEQGAIEKVTIIGLNNG